MVEAFAHKLTGCQNHSRSICRQRFEFGGHETSLFLRHAPMQCENLLYFSGQHLFDGRDVFGALGQNENLAPTGKCADHFVPDGRRTVRVGSDMPEYILDTCFGGYVNCRRLDSGNDLKVVVRPPAARQYGGLAHTA